MIGKHHALPFAAGAADSSPAACFLHVGTHKTGTTSLQRVLTAHEQLFAQAGMYIPRAGRAGAGGHHNIAWELNDDERFDPLRGTFADLLEEIERQQAPRVCLSSEDFEYLYARPDALHTLADGIRAIGYRPIVIVYLRPQAGYLESLYAELVRHGLALSFAQFFTAIVTAGEFRFNDRWRFRFDYAQLLDEFADVFGPSQIIARCYETGASDIVRDFLPLIGAENAGLEQRVARSPRLNAGLRCADVLRLFEHNACAARGLAPPTRPIRGFGLGGRFDPVSLTDLARIIDRFNPGSRRVYEQYGALVPCVSGRDLVADLAAAAYVDPAARSRRRHVHVQARKMGLPTAASPPRSQVMKPPSAERAKSAIFSPEFRRPAFLEAVIVGTAAVVATASLTYGQRIASTTLVEFGLLSIIVALSAAALLICYAVESRAVITDHRFFAEWGARLSVAGYAAVGAYALVNAILDVELARYDPDWISYPGTIAVAAAALVLTALQPLRRRLRGEVARRPMFAGLGDDRVYLASCYVALATQVAHAVIAVWWLDTTIDILVVGLVAAKVRQIRRTPDARAGVWAAR